MALLRTTLPTPAAYLLPVQAKRRLNGRKIQPNAPAMKRSSQSRSSCRGVASWAVRAVAFPSPPPSPLGGGGIARSTLKNRACQVFREAGGGGPPPPRGGVGG